MCAACNSGGWNFCTTYFALSQSGPICIKLHRADLHGYARVGRRDFGSRPFFPIISSAFFLSRVQRDETVSWTKKRYGTGWTRGQWPREWVRMLDDMGCQAITSAAGTRNKSARCMLGSRQARWGTAATTTDWWGWRSQDGRVVGFTGEWSPYTAWAAATSASRVKITDVDRVLQ